MEDLAGDLTSVTRPMYTGSMSTDVQQVVSDLISNPAVTLVIGGDIEDGDRVSITVGDVTAYGTVGHRSLHWSTMRGVNSLPVILDGTGQEVVVHTSQVAKVTE